MKEIPLLEMVRLYCETQEAEPMDVMLKLQLQRETYRPTGFMLLRCVMLDSSYLGTRVIVPYGPNNTFKEPPDHPISPRGLASDMSTVEEITVLKYE